MTSGLDSTTVPADVAAVAATRDLGGHRESYPNRTSKRLLFGFGVLWVVLGAIAVLALVGVGSGDDSAVGPAIGFTGAAALFLAAFLWVLLRGPAVSKAARRLQVHVFEQGWVRVRRKGVEVYRWDEVQTLYAQVTVQVTNGISQTSYRYQLTFADGRKIVLGTLATDMARFGPVLASQVAQAQLPKAMSYFDKDNPVAFGDFTITDEGVRTRRGKVLAWSEIGGVLLDNGHVSIADRAGKRISPQTLLGKIPNGYTFLLMMDTVLGKLRGAQA
ncbi:DUF6585 family protein [Catellatospora vulcania]|uniref:DUF6585 family protein n=1 Tax=Catellatospora vulcania TaxID=1460450 RepID=UPI0012D3DAD7|nr:DUF6585 family protein [Catellatospora vulcania]